MKYKICRFCDAHLDCGESCDCRQETSAEVKIDFAEVLKWAKTLEKKYPALANLKEEKLGTYTILRLPLKIGVKIGFIATFHKNIVDELRRQNYVVAAVENQDAAKYWLLDIVKTMKERNSAKTPKNRRKRA
jgi:hypothetical protein